MKPAEPERAPGLIDTEKPEDPRMIPVRLERPVPQGDGIEVPTYSKEDQATWAVLYDRQRPILEQSACREYLEGLEHMAFPRDRIPSLPEASRVLRETVGWEVARVPGLVSADDFFAFLARGQFPSTDYIRGRHELDYTPAPDLFHDVLGHLPMLTQPETAEFYRAMGAAGVNARGEDRRRVERFYWFTAEYGLIQTPDGVRLYGSGLLSSHGESRHCLTAEVERLPFDPEALAETEYQFWHYQPRLFVIESFLQLFEEFRGWASRRKLLT